MYFRVELLKIEQNIQANDAIKLFILIKLTFINNNKNNQFNQILNSK